MLPSADKLYGDADLQLYYQSSNEIKMCVPIYLKMTEE